MRTCAVIPAFDAARTVGGVVRGLREALPELTALVVVDDGSMDGTAAAAAAAGAEVITLPANRGKGAALRAGLERARALGCDVALTVDADGQHPPASAARVLRANSDPAALVLGVRDLARDGAPRPNRISNGISNGFLSLFALRRFHDTQCGLRRYPVAGTLALRARAQGYAFEAEVLLRAAAARVPILEIDTRVHYPPEHERVTHFDSLRDPWRIVAVVVHTLAELRLAPRTLAGRALRAAALAALAAYLVLALAHAAVGAFIAVHAPAIDLPRLPLQPASAAPADLRRAGRGWTRVRRGVREVYLEGSPEEMGAEHSSLLRERMIADEKELWDDFSTFVPLAPARALLVDVGRVRYRHVDRGIPEPRRRELAAESSGLHPDPFDGRMPSYQRLVFLHALYDIALSFEHSPLIGCTVLGLGPGATADGHALVARAFDFEAGEAFDRDKAVYLVRGDGTIPFASVAWPGLVGVVTGMNLEGVWLSVNGARAAEPAVRGVPVVFALREALERARTTDEAIEVLRRQTVMVSHLVFVGDVAAGRFAVVERAPGHESFVRRPTGDQDRVALTNHFEGPLSDDPRDRAVRAGTTSLARRARADELLAGVGPHLGDVPRLAGMLRDHGCAGGAPCALGDRRAIDALIAAHGVVADTTARSLWVSAFPHMSNELVRVDLRAIFAAGHDPARDPAPAALPPDPIFADGRYRAALARKKEAR